MASRHPSDLDLECYLLDRGASRLSGHVVSCAGCQARVARMEAHGEQFLRYVYPATVARVEAAAGGRRPAWRRWVLLPAPMAALTAAILLAGLTGSGTFTRPPEGYVGPKGGDGGLGLTVFVGSAHGARPVGNGDAVPASSALRFKVQPARACRLWVVSVDDAGQISRLYPSTGEGGAEIASGGPLPGGAVLDGRRGLERIFAVCTPSPLTYSSLEQSVRRAVGRGATSLRRADGISGLPVGTVQASVLIDKRE